MALRSQGVWVKKVEYLDKLGRNLIPDLKFPNCGMILPESKNLRFLMSGCIAGVCIL